MAEVGIKTAYIKVNGKTIELDHSYLGVAKADFKGLSGNLTNISGSNRIQYSYVEPNKPTLALTVNQAGSTLIANITGATKLGENGLFTPGDKLPAVGVAVVAPELGLNKDRVIIFDKARATVSTVSLSTNTDSKKQVVFDQITFNANYSDALKDTYTQGYIDTDTAESVLQQLGWPTVAKGSGDFKDDADGSVATSSGVQPKHD